MMTNDLYVICHLEIAQDALTYNKEGQQVIHVDISNLLGVNSLIPLVHATI